MCHNNGIYIYRMRIVNTAVYPKLFKMCVVDKISDTLYLWNVIKLFAVTNEFSLFLNKLWKRILLSEALKTQYQIRVICVFIIGFYSVTKSLSIVHLMKIVYAWWIFFFFLHFQRETLVLMVCWLHLIKIQKSCTPAPFSLSGVIERSPNFSEISKSHTSMHYWIK